MAAINANLTLRSTRVFGPNTSAVWQHFGFEQNENDNDVPTCTLCLKKLRAAGGNSPNLRRHLKDDHPVESSMM